MENQKRRKCINIPLRSKDLNHLYTRFSFVRGFKWPRVVGERANI